MFTVDTVLEALKKFDVDDATLLSWEEALGISIPVDEYGRKQYSPHHVNLFKNVKKHLALGRTLDQIRDLVALPPSEEATPLAVPAVKPNAYAQAPKRPSIGRETPPEVVHLLDKLVSEKDGLQNKLIETEKLNSHLYNANNVFHRKVKELTTVVGSLKEQIQENRNFKLLDEKDKLHKELIETQKNNQIQEHELQALRKELAKTIDEKSAQINQLTIERDQAVQSLSESLENQANALNADRERQLQALRDEREQQIQALIAERERQVQTLVDERNAIKNHLEELTYAFKTDRFCGDWKEESELVEVLYDNFGINIEPRRNRLFRISEPPIRAYGNTAVITTEFEYANNSLWRRQESLVAVYLPDESIQGELTTEYIIDGVPVAKAIYRVRCHRAVS